MLLFSLNLIRKGINNAQSSINSLEKLKEKDFDEKIAIYLKSKEDIDYMTQWLETDYVKSEISNSLNLYRHLGSVLTINFYIKNRRITYSSDIESFIQCLFPWYERHQGHQNSKRWEEYIYINFDKEEIEYLQDSINKLSYSSD